jgi:hypothetical protein
LKNAPGFKQHPVCLIVLLACTVFFASCSGDTSSNSSPITSNTQTSAINTQATKLSTNLMGPATIPANGKAMYHTVTGQTGGTNKEIHFPSLPSPSAFVTVTVTINGAIQETEQGAI